MPATQKKKRVTAEPIIAEPYAVQKRSSKHGFARALVLLGLSFFPVEVKAQDTPSVGLGTRALPAIGEVGVPILAQSVIAASVSGGYGYIEGFDPLSSSVNRAQGAAAFVYSPIPQLSIGADVRGHLDASTGGGNPAREQGFPRLTLRGVHQFTETVSAGVQVDVKLYGKQAPDIEPSAITPSLSALLSKRLGDSTWISGQLGFVDDNSVKALPNDENGDPTVPTDYDPEARVAFNASSWSYLEFGVGMSHLMQRIELEWLAEFALQQSVGKQAPGFWVQNPRLSGGARKRLWRNFSVLGLVHFNVGGRAQDVGVGPNLYRSEPRLAFEVGLSFHPRPSPEKERTAPPPPEEPPKKAEVVVPPPPPPPPKTRDVMGTVVDEKGRPLPDVLVIVRVEGAEVGQMRTYADGTFTFKELSNLQEVEFEATTPGYRRESAKMAAGASELAPISLVPAGKSGEVRGTVRTMAGEPLPAKITLLPEGQGISVQTDGSFDVELSPGRYTVLIEYEGYKPQKRALVVEEAGVTIVNFILEP